ncbi:MAG: RNA 3'-terminal phosphate cyclase [Pseudomonadota bacterium]|nr:MAG: RNA 3'-terminal phosphate cyclase [Pseudomonadota bacterium]
MLRIDGAYGEGGGQILRTALALSVLLGTPFRIERIRHARSKPGLMHQHLMAVQAAQRICRGEVQGGALGSQQLVFTPGDVLPGEYRFDIGTAGSTTLVLQTILPPLLSAPGPTLLVLEGGTHNPHAPPADFLEHAFLPLINRMGPAVSMRLVRPGFYPAGGGVLEIEIQPARRPQPLYLEERGEFLDLHARALLSRLPDHIAARELGIIGRAFDLHAAQLETVQVVDAKGPGNAVMVAVRSRHVTEVFTGIGRRGVPAETVAGGVVDAVRRYLASGAPVGEHLADQLLLPLAMAGAGAFVSLPPTRHTTTNIAVIGRFLDMAIDCEALADGNWRIAVA